MTVHACPHCTCRWEGDVPRTLVNPDAPGYPLVMLIASLHGELGDSDDDRRESRG